MPTPSAIRWASSRSSASLRQRRETLHLRVVSAAGGVVCEGRARRIWFLSSHVCAGRQVPQNHPHQKTAARPHQARLTVLASGAGGRSGEGGYSGVEDGVAADECEAVVCYGFGSFLRLLHGRWRLFLCKGASPDDSVQSLHCRVIARLKHQA